jgi:DNA invertase Pin-like site-specific DNA recombinase
MLVGYMRVSTESDRQGLDLQRDALLAAGVDERQLFEDRASGSRDDRAGLGKALAFIRAGDCLVVWKLDRLGRSLPHLLGPPPCSASSSGLNTCAPSVSSLSAAISSTRLA